MRPESCATTFRLERARPCQYLRLSALRGLSLRHSVAARPSERVHVDTNLQRFSAPALDDTTRASSSYKKQTCHWPEKHVPSPIPRLGTSKFDCQRPRWSWSWMLTSAMFVCFERDVKVPATVVGAGGVGGARGVARGTCGGQHSRRSAITCFQA